MAIRVDGSSDACLISRELDGGDEKIQVGTRVVSSTQHLQASLDEAAEEWGIGLSHRSRLLLGLRSQVSVGGSVWGGSTALAASRAMTSSRNSVRAWRDSGVGEAVAKAVHRAASFAFLDDMSCGDRGAVELLGA